MATISSFRAALLEPEKYFSQLAKMRSCDGNILSSTYFAETKVQCNGNKLIYMPLSAVSLRRVERFIPLKRHLTNSVVPQLTILREEMRYKDAQGRSAVCDILCEPMPEGFPFADAVASVASEEEAAQLIAALEELQAQLLQADVSHNNIREENIYLDDNNHLSLVRWYYATAGAGGDKEAFAALRAKIADKCAVALREPDYDNYTVATPLTGHLSVRFMREGLAAVEHETGWGFVDSDNRIVIEPKYEWVSDFCEGRAEVQTEQGMGLIDRHGVCIIPPFYKIVEYDAVSGCSQALDDEGWHVFSYEGDELADDMQEEDAIYPPPAGALNSLIDNKIINKNRKLWNRQNVLLSVAALRALRLPSMHHVQIFHPSFTRVSSLVASSLQLPRLRTSLATPRVSAVRL